MRLAALSGRTRSPCGRRCWTFRRAGWIRPPAPDRRREIEERACEALQRRWECLPWRSQLDVRSRGLLGNIGDPKRYERADDAFVLWCQLGWCARMAVADVVSGGRRRKRIAGALHCVQLVAWLEGRTNPLSQPIARAAWAAESYPGLRITAIGTSRANPLQSRHS